MTKLYDVYAVGSAFVDRVVTVPDSVLNSIGYAKGGIHLIDGKTCDRLEKILIHYPSSVFCGGSGGNTLTALHAAGGRGFYSCAVGDDEEGAIYRDNLQKNGIHNSLQFYPPKNHMTSRCTILVTPDGERTLLSLVGASNKMTASDLHALSLAASKCIFIEGFIFLSASSRQTVHHAYELALSHSVKTVLSLSTCLFSSALKETLVSTFRRGIDLLFCNEQEAFHFCETTDTDEVIRQLSQIARQFVVTRGEKGALLFDGNYADHCPSVPAKILDLTGAGDAYAGGFLYGFCNGYPFHASGALAAKMASEVISQPGPRIRLEIGG